MKLTSFLCAIVFAIIGCAESSAPVAEARSMAPPPANVPSPPAPQTQLFIESWKPARHRLLKAHHFDLPSLEFAMYVGDTFAQLQDVIGSWRIVGGETLDVLKTESDLRGLLRSVDDIDQFMELVDNREALAILVNFFDLLAEQPLLTIVPWEFRKVQLGLQKPPQRSIRELRDRIQIQDPDFGNEKYVCYWLGVWAREQEKKREDDRPTRKICGGQRLDKIALKQLLEQTEKDQVGLRQQ